MQNTRPQTPMGHLWNSIQSWLFPVLEDEIGALDDKHRQFVAVCELCAPQDHMTAYRWCGNGCPPSDRLALCKAYIAKAVWDFATTRDLIDALLHRPALRRLCGWESLGEVPSEARCSGNSGAVGASESPVTQAGRDEVCSKTAIPGPSHAQTHRNVRGRAISTYRTPRGDRRRRATRGVLQEPPWSDPVRTSGSTDRRGAASAATFHGKALG